MENQTTPETPVQQTEDTSGSDRGSATTAEPTELVPETTDEGAGQTAEGDRETQDSGSDDVETWAKSQNLDLSNPEDAKKLAIRFRDTQKSLHATTKERSDLRKQMEAVPPPTSNVDETDPLAVELQELKSTVQQQALERSVDRFYMDNPDAKELDGEMAAILEKKPWLANDLDSLYIITKASHTNENIETAKNQGRTEALQSVARRQRASAPNASASTGASPKDLTDEDIGNMSLSEYKAQRSTILRKAGIPER